MEFQWDADKAVANLRKHEVSFQTATEAFGDRNAIEFLDDTEDYGEERFVLIGGTGRGLARVAHTMRNDRIRIISARKANRREREDYHRENDA